MRGGSVHLAPAGSLRETDRPVVSFFDEGREGQLRSVRRPRHAGRRLIDARHLRGCPFGVHPADEDLRASRFAGCRVGDAVAGRRPAGARTLHQKTVPAAVRVHDPERGFAAVVHLVDPAARVDDLRAVGRQLRIGDGLHLEKGVEREAVRLRHGLGGHVVAGLLVGALRAERRRARNGERTRGGKSESMHRSHGRASSSARLT